MSRFSFCYAIKGMITGAWGGENEMITVDQVV